MAIHVKGGYADDDQRKIRGKGSSAVRDVALRRAFDAVSFVLVRLDQRLHSGGLVADQSNYGIGSARSSPFPG